MILKFFVEPVIVVNLHKTNKRKVKLNFGNKKYCHIAVDLNIYIRVYRRNLYHVEYGERDKHEFYLPLPLIKLLLTQVNGYHAFQLPQQRSAQNAHKL